MCDDARGIGFSLEQLLEAMGSTVRMDGGQWRVTHGPDRPGAYVQVEPSLEAAVRLLALRVLSLPVSYGASP